MLQPVKLKSDGDGHNYLIPNDREESFDWYMNAISENEDDQQVIDNFEEVFSMYRLGGDINNTQLYADIK